MNYMDLIFTNHAIDKMAQRGIRQEDAYETFKHPDLQKNDRANSFEFIKQFTEFKISLIGKQNEKGEWVAISVWRDPPLPGTADAKEKVEWKGYSKAGFWGKLWHEAKQQLGFRLF